MENLESISKRNIEKAFEIIAELEIQKTWENLNSTCNLVGSVKTGLLMNKLDIDFHTYSNDFSIEKSFSAIAQFLNYSIDSPCDFVAFPLCISTSLNDQRGIFFYGSR